MSLLKKFKHIFCKHNHQHSKMTEETSVSRPTKYVLESVFPSKNVQEQVLSELQNQK